MFYWVHKVHGMGWGFITLFFYEWWRRGGTYDEERVIICVHHHHHPPLVQLVEIKAKIADSKGEWAWGGGEGNDAGEFWYSLYWWQKASKMLGAIWSITTITHQNSLFFMTKCCGYYSGIIDYIYYYQMIHINTNNVLSKC